ncbi:hypothetical protein OOJ91_33685 [Micromonospora lupini]|uniref:hypothetical protein n=1 Tax=Micromonospora lupini TaxID=285679 RepID=UPI00225ACF1E|nr:hypothetical protein [Micromonospora lupini]MCX5070799.1 hypothetical protein [Micromonospora lupini]
MKGRPSTEPPTLLCANCLVIVGQHGDQLRHTALLDPARYEVCDSPVRGRPAKAGEVARGHGKPVGRTR